MKIILQYWIYSYFTQPALVVIILISFVVAIRQWKQYQALRYLPLYLGSFIVLIAVDYTILAFFGEHNPTASTIMMLSEFFVTLIEFITFSYFVYIIINITRFKYIIKYTSSIILIILLFTTILNVYSKSFTSSLLNTIYIFESTALLFYCIFAIIDIFNKPPLFRISQYPNFWVTSGLTLYLLVSFPITIIEKYLARTDSILYKNFYSIIYISYIIMFLMIIKGYHCKAKEIEFDFFKEA